MVPYILNALADRAYPSWDQERKQELVRDQFIQGIRSAAVQLQLMRDRPGVGGSSDPPGRMTPSHSTLV